MRYRVDHPIRVGRGRPIRVDIAFTRDRLVVFVDGCFWHGCPTHHRPPKTNAAYWAGKVDRNQARDQRDSDRLLNAGWTVLRFWEHEPVEEMLASVIASRDLGRQQRSDSSHVRAG